jgi:5'-3' exonuclease
MRDEDGIREKFGVGPASIPDYLALVGDAADGFPGLPGWGAKSTSTVLARFEHLERIPHDWKEWGVGVRGGARLARSLVEGWDDALLFRKLATLRTDAPTFEDLDELRWKGPAGGFDAVCAGLGDPGLVDRVRSLARRTT